MSDGQQDARIVRIRGRLSDGAASPSCSASLAKHPRKSPGCGQAAAA
jgi:hypothetical protein